MDSAGPEVGSAVPASLCPQTWMSVSGRTMQVACMTVSTSLVITDAPATTDSTWHMMDTTVWVSKGERGWGRWDILQGRGCFQHFPFPRQGGKSNFKELHSHKRARTVSSLGLASKDEIILLLDEK